MSVLIVYTIGVDVNAECSRSIDAIMQMRLEQLGFVRNSFLCLLHPPFCLGKLTGFYRATTLYVLARTY